MCSPVDQVENTRGELILKLLLAAPLFLDVIGLVIGMKHCQEPLLVQPRINEDWGNTIHRAKIYTSVLSIIELLVILIDLRQALFEVGVKGGVFWVLSLGFPARGQVLQDRDDLVEGWRPCGGTNLLVIICVLERSLLVLGTMRQREYWTEPQ